LHVLFVVADIFCFLVAYEASKAHFQSTIIHDSVWNPILSGGLAGIAAWLPGYPQDVIKSVIQSHDKHLSLPQATRQIFKSHGVKGFFKGFTPTMLRAFPANAATFLGYELVMSTIK
jgi:solute carrier family 25 (mitochondrial carnitine/acylcarnitine transporter), member 20/29